MNKLLCLLALLLVLSCSKSDSPTPNPPPDQHKEADTVLLTTGWSKIKVADSLLTDIAWIDANNLVVSSPNTRQILSSTNGGLTWGPLPFYAYGDNLIAFPDGTLSWTNVVSKGWVGRLKNGSVDSVNMPAQAADLYYLDAMHGFASLNTGSGLAETHDGGDSWHAVPTGISMPGNVYYSTLFFLDSLHGLISFGTHIFNTTNGIHNWQPSTVPSPPSDSYPCSKLVLATPSVAYAGFATGNLLRSQDSGRTFSSLPIPTTNNNTGRWMDLQFFDADHGFASYKDVILHTNNGGANWDTAVYVKGKLFIELEFLDQNHGAACTTDGSVYLFKN